MITRHVKTKNTDGFEQLEVGERRKEISLSFSSYIMFPHDRDTLSYLPLTLRHTQLDISNCDNFKIEYCSSHDPISSSFFIINSLSLSLRGSLLSFSLSLPRSLCLCIIFTLSLPPSLSLTRSLARSSHSAPRVGHCGHVCKHGYVLRVGQQLVLGDQGFEHAVGDEL